MINFVTYFDQNYLDRFWSLYESLNKNCSNFHIYAIKLNNFIIDEKLQNSPKITFINLDQVEKEYPELYLAKKNRSLVEYYFTLTPFAVLYVFNAYKLDEVSYIDSDLYFFNNPKIIYDEYKDIDYNILLTTHGNKNIQKKYGKFNVGWIVLKNNIEVNSCLKQWSSDCITWCFDEAKDGKFADQKYLDDWENDYEKVFIVDKFLINIGPWNFDKISENNLSKLICYHFHNLNIYKKTFISNISIFIKLNKKKKELIRSIYRPYINHLIKIRENSNIIKHKNLRAQNTWPRIVKILKLLIVIKNLDIYKI
jgi:hypothetical protein